MQISHTQGDPNFADYAERYVADHLAYLRALPLATIGTAIDMLWAAYTRGATIFTCGNGGSAAMAAHFASDLAKTTISHPQCAEHTQRFRAVSLVDNSPLVTAWSNDDAFERIFAEPLRNLARPGDVLVAISGSGTSPNIVAAVQAAGELQVQTIGITGQSGGYLRTDADVCISVETDAYEHNEPLHSTIFHLITFYLRERLRGPSGEALVSEAMLAPAGTSGSLSHVMRDAAH